MIDSYQSIFKKRAQAYHEAMLASTHARDEEFEVLFTYIDIKPSDIVADMPSGSAYLQRYIDNTIYFIDPAKEFLDNTPSHARTLHTELDNIAIESNFFDIICSLAGSHHMRDKLRFYQEVYRLLKPEAHFVYADVLEGSKEDIFLNNFVDTFNSLGHKGVFINPQTKQILESLHFTIKHYEYKQLRWHFAHEKEMLEFVKKLFGIDLAEDALVLEELQNILGYTKTEEACLLNWGLLYITSTKGI